jgi:ATP-dependent protease ClpP protease subunit
LFSGVCYSGDADFYIEKQAPDIREVVWKDDDGCDRELEERSLQLKRDRLAFDREKWEYEKSETQREEFEKRFSEFCDFRVTPPVINLKMDGYRATTDDAMRSDINMLREMGHNKVILNVFSGGGSGFLGLALADVINDFVQDGMEIEAHAYGIVASAAVPIFASASTRVSNNSVLFMVHEAAIWEFSFGMSKTTHSDIRSQKDMMDEMEKLYLNILAAHSNKDWAFWKDLESKTTWFTPEKAMEWGLVDEIK